MSKWNFDKLKQFGATLLASGKQNAPSLMTAGSVVLGWTAVYIFWRQSKKAEKKIAEEAKKLDEKQEDIPPSEREQLPIQEKASIYLRYCWTALVLGVTSSGLSIMANKLNLSRIAELALLTQFMNGKDEKQKDLIARLREEIGEKRAEEINNEQLDKEYPKEKVLAIAAETGGKGQTLFIDRFTNARFRADIVEVMNGIARFNNDLRDNRTERIKRQLGDAFYTSDLPWGSEESTAGIYSSLDLDEFLEEIGETTHSDDYKRSGLGDLLEFRYYGGDDVVKANQILRYKRYEDPETGIPVVCYIDYGELLMPTDELLERNVF